jgi:hypothetical protein
MKKAEAREFDEYGQIRQEDQEPRLDNFAIELQNDPTAVGYIIAYGGRAAKAGSAQRAADKAKDYLVKKRGLTPDRVLTLDGGRREEAAFELWLVPAGADLPHPTPTLEPAETRPASPAKPKTRKKRKT